MIHGIFSAGMALGGAISGEHGIGSEKKLYFQELEDPAKLALLRRMLNLGHRASPPKIFAVPYIAMLPENNVRQGFVEDSDFARLVAEARKEELWLRVFLELANNLTATILWR